MDAAAADRQRLLKLAVIGTASGAFSGVFGVGGGSVIVPLLILWFAYGPREATGTSLAALGVIAAFAVIGQAFYGNVGPLDGLIVAAPAVAGVIAGAAAQQRVPERVVLLLFSLLLVVIATELVIP
jgi:uncharacterized membrane protein YfcA